VSRYQPDMMFSRFGKPVLVVEAKGRPVTRDFEPIVRRQLNAYSTETGAPWAILVDPQDTWIFKSHHTEPIARLATTDVLGEALSDRPTIVGEQVILIALDRVVPNLKDRGDFLRRHPELREFADAVAGAESTSHPHQRG
jgi:hypothetical protein